MTEITTIGHSTLAIEVFLERLTAASISMLVDIRSMPYSRFQPQFSQPNLQPILQDNGIEYVFLGGELGGRPLNAQLFTDGIADYEKMAREPSFIEAIDQLITRAEIDNIALMCSEGVPIECHRVLLLGRVLKEKGCSIKHLTVSKEFISQDEVEAILLEKARKKITDDLLSADKLNLAYHLQARKVAFRIKPKYNR
jgi:uncharacterized protein (DUF488 family)